MSRFRLVCYCLVAASAFAQSTNLTDIKPAIRSEPPTSILAGLTSHSVEVRAKAWEKIGWSQAIDLHTPIKLEFIGKPAGEKEDEIALLTADIQTSMTLVFFVRHRGLWYQVLQLESWEKYGDDPMRNMLTYEYTSTLGTVFKLRTTGGGTGAFVRDLDIFRIVNRKPQLLYSGREFHRECPFPEEKCTYEARRVELKSLDYPNKGDFVVERVYAGVFGVNIDIPETGFDKALPLKSCTIYSWNRKKATLEKQSSRELKYCED